jgi:hypothetical protein
MSEDSAKSRLLPLSGLLMLFAVLGVIFYQNVPFEGSRPPAPDISEQQQRVKARLWQDPFLAVINAPNNDDNRKEASVCLVSSCSSWKNPREFSDPFKTRLRTGAVTVVGVMVFGAPHAEEGEMRIRQRYAALSAFHRLGFSPEDPEHIEYVRIVPEATSGNSENPSMADIMPFEWLTKENGEDDSILLLWINDDLFHEKPLDKLTRLSTYLPRQPDGSPVAAPSFTVIGPAGSATLRGMVENVNALLKNPVQELPERFTIYSPTATVDDSILLQGFGDSRFAKKPSETVEARFRQAGFPLRRTNCPDGQLAEKIRDELFLRGIDCRNGKSHIVLLSEWDTYYGRSLTEVYKQAFRRGGVADFDRQIHSFGFLRGVDGKIPDQKETGETSGRKKEKNDSALAPDTARELERATGMSQYDYIRRLADEIYSLEQHLDGGGVIRAIGVLGSDFHDKYLLLQALRQRFPQSVYFTTDLDARFLHPAAFPWTRNLIVASSFNLGLRNDDHINLQGDIPPFRDSSQTALFYSILRSFDQGGSLDAKLRAVLRQNPRPKIFEIGRYRVVDLSEDPGDAISFYPRPREANNSKRTARKAVMISLLLVALLYFSCQQARTLIHMAFSGWKRVVATLASLLLVALAVLAFYHRILLNPHLEEPLSFLEGVSGWPAEFLRLIAVLLSLFLIWRARTKIRENSDEINREFGFSSLQNRSPGISAGETVVPKDKSVIPGELFRIFRTFTDIIGYDWTVEAAVDGSKVTIDHYWREYRRRDSFLYRFIRLAPIILSYIALCGLIISFSRPMPPVRGSISILSDTVILGMSVLASILLIFYSFDVIRICRRFIDLLAEQAPAWSAHSLSILAGPEAEKAKESMGEWMLVHLIAQRTEVVGRVVFYPFIVWFIMVVSRLDYFDNWRTPVGLAIVITLGAAFAWSCALVLRWSAEHARQMALHRLMKMQVSAVAAGSDAPQLKRIEFAMDSVRSNRRGAFAPYSQSPVIQALMVPFGGFGVYVLDVLGKFNM